MNLHFLLNAGLGGIELSGTGVLIAVAIFACLLGVEVAGISILISKMSRAHREKQEIEAQERSSSRHYYYGCAVFMLGVIPQTTYVALSVLAGLVAVAAVVFVVALIVFHKKGYAFISSKDAAVLVEAENTPVSPAEESAPAALPDESEEQRQDAYTETEETAASEDAFSVFEDETDYEKVYEEFYEEAPAEEVEGEVLPENGQAVSAPEAPVAEGPAFADGTRPYKIVEKIVTETQKEVVREVPAAAPQSEAAEQLMEKLTDFLDYELQKRKENDEAQSSASNDGTVATFAQNMDAKDEDPDEDEDEDEDELDDIDDAKSEDEDDIDDEEPDSEDRFTGNERIIGFDENTGCYIVAHYRKSFEAKLIQARPRIKEYYSELKNALLSYKGTKSRISWSADSFHNGRTQIAKINVKTNILELYLALDPDSLEGTVYRGRNVGSKKKYADTPFLYKLRTPRKFKWAMELVQRTCEEQGLSPIDIEKVDYGQLYPFETTESLVERKLIKEYIREEKPATTFELDPDHVPAVPDEDESVIPANANFSWEFDNEMLELKEEEVEEIPETVEEPVLEEAVAEEAPVAEETSEPAAQPVSNVIKETVKITEMRYTERYYADAQPSYEEFTTTQELILPAADASSEDAVYEGEEAEEVSEQAELDEEYTFVSEDVAEEDVTEEVYEASEEAYEESETSEEGEEFFFDEAVEESSEDAPEAYYEEVVEEYAEEENPTEEYTEELPEEEYVEEEYAEELPEEEYVEEEYAEELPEEEYVEEEYPEEEYAEEEYEEVSEEEAYGEPEEEVPAQPRRASAAPQHALDPSVAVIDICSVADAFNDGDTVSLETLKAKGLVVSSAQTLKIYSGGTLTKRLSVEAHHFSLEAIFAIGTAGGETSMLY